MSLKAWYPLIRDAKNNGVGDLTPLVTQTLSFVGNGKIGSTCLNSGGLRWSSQQTASVFNNNEISIAFWIKVIGSASGIMIGTDSMGASNNRKFTLFQYPTANDFHWSWMNDAASTVFCGGSLQGVFPTNTWTHCCVTYKNPNFKVYINGNVAATSSGVSNSSTFAYDTQILHSNSSRCINDLRFYNHELSAKEVKMLAQGLVAHYQLKGMGRTNYLKGSDKYTKKTPLIRKSNDVSHMNDSYVYHGSNLTAIIPTQGTYTWILNSDGVPTSHPTSGTSGASRYFSMWLQNQSTGDHYLWSGQGTGSDGKMYGSITIPAGSYNVRTNLYAADNSVYTVKFWDMKIVQGAYEPDDVWCPHADDGRYKDFGLDSLYEQDVSGNGNHARKSAALTVAGDSPRNGSCYEFNGSSYISCGRGAMVTDAITVSCWSYMNNWGDYTSRRMASCTESGGWNLEPNGENASNGMCFAVGTGTSSNSYHNAVSDITCNSLSSGWHMFTGTYDGYTSRIYIDGVLRGSSSAKSSKTPIFYNSSNGIFIGAEAATSSTSPGGQYFNGKISDFRIYGTALSATDISDLYKNAASLTKGGKLFAYNFHENKKKAVNKNGIVSSQNFINKKAPIYDMKVMGLGDGSTWARIHHLDVSNDAIFFANAAEVAECTNKHNRYSRMGLVDKFKAGSEYEFMLTYPVIKQTLPAGYTRLEYIEATGSQWINTGVTGHARWEFDIQFTNTTKRQLMGYYGNQDEYWGCQTDGKYGLFAGSTIGKAGKRDTIVHDFQQGAATLWVQNTTLGVGGNATLGSNQYQLFNIMSANYTCHAKLWRCKCIQNGNLIRDFIPAQRNSDGAIGLYDIVNGVFYGNAGSGVFCTNYTPLASQKGFIQSTGSQYINTGINEGTAHGLRMIFEVSGTATAWQSLISGALDNFTVGTRDTDRSGFYIRLRGAEVINQGGLLYGKNELIINNGIVLLNGRQIATYSAGALSTGTGNIYVFANNALSRYGCMRLYELDIYGSSSQLLRSYIPSVTGNTGLYDKVSKTLFGNNGSGSFTCRRGTTLEGYQWLDYIEGNGTQYINTGFNPNSNSRIVIKALGSSYYSIYGVNYSGANFNLTASSSNGGVMYFYWGSGGASKQTNYINQVHTFEQNKNVCYVDGATYHTYTNASWSSPVPVFLFARTSNGTSANDIGGTVRIYSCQLYDNGTLVRDFVPCVNPYGEVGLYDKVTGGFFGNSGSGNFIAGTAKESIPTYNRWIQTSSPNSGTVSGFKPIFTSWTAHHGGIRKNGSSTVYNCDVGGTWYAAIGQTKVWDSASNLYLPAADGTDRRETELWVRTDRLSNENQLNIYDGMTTAKDYAEF